MIDLKEKSEDMAIRLRNDIAFGESGTEVSAMGRGNYNTSSSDYILDALRAVRKDALEEAEKLMMDMTVISADESGRTYMEYDSRARALSYDFQERIRKLIEENK